MGKPGNPGCGNRQHHGDDNARTHRQEEQVTRSNNFSKNLIKAIFSLFLVDYTILVYSMYKKHHF